MAAPTFGHLFVPRNTYFRSPCLPPAGLFVFALCLRIVWPLASGEPIERNAPWLLTIAQLASVGGVIGCVLVVFYKWSALRLLRSQQWSRLKLQLEREHIIRKMYHATRRLGVPFRGRGFEDSSSASPFTAPRSAAFAARELVHTSLDTPLVSPGSNLPAPPSSERRSLDEKTDSTHLKPAVTLPEPPKSSPAVIDTVCQPLSSTARHSRY